MAKVLVTGGAGFIGSHVTDALIADGQQVVVIDNLSTGKEENINARAMFYNMDICNPRLDEIFAKENIEWVNHHAAQIDVRKSVAEPQRDVQTNIHGLLNLLGNCLRYGIKGVVFASSGGVVYGEPDHLPVAETYPKAPLSPYGVSKLTSEYYLYYYSRVHNLPYIALRYGNVYGPRQDPNGEAGVVAIFSKKMLAGEIPTIFGDGEQIRDYIFVEEVAMVNLLAMRRVADMPPPGSIDDSAYNIGTGIGTSVSKLFRYLADITAFRESARYGTERKGELKQIFLDVTKAERELSWKPSVGLFDGLESTVDFFKKVIKN